MPRFMQLQAWLASTVNEAQTLTWFGKTNNKIRQFTAQNKANFVITFLMTT